MSTDLVGKTVTTGKRNYNQNNDMTPKSIDLPIKKFEAPPVSSGKRDTPLSSGGSATPRMKG